MSNRTPETNQPIIAATGLAGMIGERVATVAKNSTWQPLEADITNRDETEAAVANTPAEVIVNFAGFTSVTEAWSDRGNKDGFCYRVNVVGVQNLAEACKRHNKFLIHISTDYVFKGDEDKTYTEKDLGDADEDWYGATKRMAEEEIRNRLASYAIVRTAFPFQPSSSTKEDLVRRMIRQFKEKSLPPMFVDTIMTPTYVDDLALVLEKVAATKSVGTFHGVGSSSLSPYELAKAVAKVFDLDVSQLREGHLEDYVRNLGRPYPRYLRLDNSWTKEKLGVKLSTLEEGLEALRSQMAEDD